MPLDDSGYSSNDDDAPVTPVAAIGGTPGPAAAIPFGPVGYGDLRLNPGADNSGSRPFDAGEYLTNLSPNPASAPRWFQPSGSWSSEMSSTVQMPDGSWSVVPGLWLDKGNPVHADEDEAAQRAADFEARTGKKFPRFGSADEAENFSVKREDDWQGKNPGDPVPPLHEIGSAPPPVPPAPSISIKGSSDTGVIGDGSLVEHKPRLEVPFSRYKDLSQADPSLYEAVNHVADDVGIPRTDLAALVYANSDNNPEARNGNRVGYMGLTPEDLARYDPNGAHDADDPLQNLWIGAQKYKDLAKLYGQGTTSSFAAYYAGTNPVDAAQRRPGSDHTTILGQPTLDFVNKVAGRGQYDDRYGSNDDDSSPDVPPPLGTFRIPSLADALSARADRARAQQSTAGSGGVPSDQPMPLLTAGDDPLGGSPAQQGLPTAAIGQLLSDPYRVGQALRTGLQVMGGAAQSVGGAIGDYAAAGPSGGDQQPAMVPPTIPPGAGDYLAKVYQGATGQPRAPTDTSTMPGTPMPLHPPAGAPAPYTPGTPGPMPLNPPAGGAPAPAASTMPGTPMPLHPPAGAPAASAAPTPVAPPARGGALAPTPTPTPVAAGPTDATFEPGTAPATAAPAALSPVGPAPVADAPPPAPPAPAAPPPTTRSAIPPVPPATTPKPPITQLDERPHTMSPQGAIRAVDQGGPDGLLTYFSRNGRPGATPQQNFDLLSQLTANMMMLKGNPEGALHAEEYYFRLQHRGAVQNTMKALTAYNTGDLQSAAQLLARAHAFVPDGAVVGFTVAGNQIIGQRYSDDSHQKIGNPFTVNASDIRAASAQVSDPVQFHTMMNQERVTNGNLIHQANEDQHNFDTLGSTARSQDLTAREQEVQLAGQSSVAQTAAREQEVQLAGQSSVAQTAANALVEKQRENDIADQTRRDIAAARNAAAKERTEMSVLGHQRDISNQQQKAFWDGANNYYGDQADTMGQVPTDLSGKPMDANSRIQATPLAYALQRNNYVNGMTDTLAHEIVKSLVAPKLVDGKPNTAIKYFLANRTPDGQPIVSPRDGAPWFAVRDTKGNAVAYIPESSLRGIAPPQMNPTPGRSMTPRVQPAVGP